MLQDSAFPSLPQSRHGLRLDMGPGPDWVRVGACVRGPLATLAAAVALDALRRHDIALLSPFPILLLTVVYAAYLGGLLPALVSVAITVLDAVHFFAQPGTPLRFAPRYEASLAAVAVSALLTAVLASRLYDRVRRAEALALARREAEALARRFAILDQGARLLGSAGDSDETFRDVARVLVPALGDWCAIHLVSEAGPFRFVAGAHRDPSRDLLVRALAEHDRERLPFGPAPTAPQVADVTEGLLREVAADAKGLALYRALAPTSVLRLPLLARNREVGFVTLGMTSASGRRFTPADVELAQALVRGAAASVDGARLREELRETDLRAGLIFDEHPQPMWIFEVETLAILAVNEAAIRHYGWPRDELMAMTILDLLAPDDVPSVPAMPERAPLRVEVALAHHRRRDGRLMDMELESHELEFAGRRARLVLATDTTDHTRTRAALHRSEEHLRQVQRAEALGRIAAGVAHDFNNLLTTIRGFGEMLLLDMVPDDRRRADVQRIRQAAERGELLTRQLLAFGRQSGQAPRPVDLNDVVRGIEPLVRRLIGADVQLDIRLARRLGPVRVDPAQVEHALVNLILGAGDAMPAGGRLTIETSERRISGLSGGRPVRPGRYVLLAIGDSGGDPVGDADDAAEEGSPGARVGVGRAIAVGIVRQYGGVVRVSSEPGAGTTVKVYLPLLEGGDEAVAAVERDPPGDAARGSETVLVAEDEDGVRELLRKILTEFGYTVLTARHGHDALMLAGERPEGVDLLVTDVVMPGMSGHELAMTLRDRRPELKVLYISGYSDDEVLQRGIGAREGGFIRKPFAAEDLVRRVRAVLDAAPA
jgi:two-component system, cell cycle sensor histidine kinase and response regulator CckA